MIRILAGVLLALAACGPSVSAENGENATDTDRPMRFDVPPQDIPGAECVFEETALPPEAEPMVKVNWGDGGFDYDLTSLLAACRARTFQNGHEYED